MKYKDRAKKSVNLRCGTGETSQTFKLEVKSAYIKQDCQ